MTAVSESEPFLLAITGPFGSGKTSVSEKASAELGAKKAVTGTTRPPREGEVHGTHYFFYKRHEMESGIDRGDFLEHALNHGNIYGTPKSSVRDPLVRGESIVVCIDPKGAKALLDMEDEVIQNALVVVWLDVSLISAIRRARNRPGGMAWSEIQTRCRTRWNEEEPLRRHFNVVSNQDGEFEKAVAEVKRLVIDRQMACQR